MNWFEQMFLVLSTTARDVQPGYFVTLYTKRTWNSLYESFSNWLNLIKIAYFKQFEMMEFVLLLLLT